MISGIVFERSNGSVWGNRFFVEICAQEIRRAQYFCKKPTRLTEREHIPITADRWQSLCARVQALPLKPKRTPFWRKLWKSPVVDGTDQRVLAIDWQGPRGVKRRWYQWPQCPKARLLEEELEALVRDLCEAQPEDGAAFCRQDPQAQKKTQSTQIDHFFCEFSMLAMLEEDTVLAGKIYCLEAVREVAGVCVTYHRQDRFSDRLTLSCEGKGDFMERLQAIVSCYDFARFNGSHRSVSGLPDFYGVQLRIRYASGECVSASDNQECFLPVKGLEELEQLFLTACR